MCRSAWATGCPRWWRWPCSARRRRACSTCSSAAASWPAGWRWVRTSNRAPAANGPRPCSPTPRARQPRASTPCAAAPATCCTPSPSTAGRRRPCLTRRWSCSTATCRRPATWPHWARATRCVWASLATWTRSKSRRCLPPGVSTTRPPVAAGSACLWPARCRASACAPMGRRPGRHRSACSARRRGARARRGCACAPTPRTAAIRRTIRW